MRQEKGELLRRIFVSPENISQDRITFDRKSANHALNSLKLKNGDKFIAVNGNGGEYLAIVTDSSKGTAAILSVSNENQDNEPVKLHLYMSLIKQTRFETAIEKCTEIGINTITPIYTERSTPSEVTDNKYKRFSSIIEQSIRQSQRLSVPFLSKSKSFAQAIKEASINGVIIIPTLSENGYPWKELREHLKPAGSLNIFIGPEGGFTESEIEFSVKNGGKILYLGKKVLRSETAAITVCSLVRFG